MLDQGNLKNIKNRNRIHTECCEYIGELGEGIRGYKSGYYWEEKGKTVELDETFPYDTVLMKPTLN